MKTTFVLPLLIWVCVVESAPLTSTSTGKLLSILDANEPNPLNGRTVDSNAPKIRVRRQVNAPRPSLRPLRKNKGVAFVYNYAQNNASGKQRSPLKALSGANGGAKTGPQGSVAAAQADSSVTANGGDMGQLPSATNSRTYTFIHSQDDYGNGSFSGSSGYSATNSDTLFVKGIGFANAGASNAMDTYSSNGGTQSSASAQAVSNSNAVAGPDGGSANSISDSSSDAYYNSPEKSSQTNNSGGSSVMANSKGPGPLSAGSSTLGSSSAKGPGSVASKGANTADVSGSNMESIVDTYASILDLSF